MKIKTLLTVVVSIVLVVIAPEGLAAQSSAGTTLTKLNLKATLENMGFEAKDLGADTYEITLNQGTIVPISVSLSTDATRIWLVTLVGKKELSSYSSEKLIKLLQSNWNTGVSFFVLNQNKLQMIRPVENRNVTPVLLRKEIEGQARSVSTTESLWAEK